MNKHFIRWFIIFVYSKSLSAIANVCWFSVFFRSFVPILQFLFSVRWTIWFNFKPSIIVVDPKPQKLCYSCFRLFLSPDCLFIFECVDNILCVAVPNQSNMYPKNVKQGMYGPNNICNWKYRFLSTSQFSNISHRVRRVIWRQVISANDTFHSLFIEQSFSYALHCVSKYKTIGEKMLSIDCLLFIVLSYTWNMEHGPSYIDDNYFPWTQPVHAVLRYEYTVWNDKRHRSWGRWRTN